MAGTHVDLEKARSSFDYLHNASILSYAWSGVTVTVKDRQTGQPKALLDNVGGHAQAGEMLALMGPSGSGKTTLLNVLAKRFGGKNVKTEADLRINGAPCATNDFRKISSYVEQEDALLGSLTARETVDFGARLATTKFGSSESRKVLVDSLIASFGLTKAADTLVGTPLRKGISGGQKRRVSVASQLVTAPRILFLDEPTSGLDSAASYEVVSLLREVTRTYKLIVIVSIHQPSSTTFELFDKLCLLAAGKTCYFGPINRIQSYFDSIGYEMPLHTNPAEFILDLVNADFAGQRHDAAERVQKIQSSWTTTVKSGMLEWDTHTPVDSSNYPPCSDQASERLSLLRIVLVLLQRAFVKSYRDIVVYGVRYAMYFGLAVLMGTVWVRLQTNQEYIQPFINAIFFGSAFMSFMAVAYVPAYLEDFAVYEKDRANGLYGPTAFMIANFIIGLPYIFGIAVLFSVISYWLSNFRPSATAFFTWIMWIFLDLVAAESLVVLVSSLVPIFVVALALIAFANGLWMSTGGFLVPLPQLNPFYKYVFHYIDYQSWVFGGMMVNEFKGRTYDCDANCNCSFPTGNLQCKIPGTAVLERYGYALNKQGEWAGILVSIIVAYRLLGWLVMWARRR